jgi:hypothetical protein
LRAGSAVPGEKAGKGDATGTGEDGTDTGRAAEEGIRAHPASTARKTDTQAGSSAVIVNSRHPCARWSLHAVVERGGHRALIAVAAYLPGGAGRAHSAHFLSTNGNAD